MISDSLNIYVDESTGAIRGKRLTSVGVKEEKNNARSL